MWGSSCELPGGWLSGAGQIAVVGRTFQYGARSGIGRLRIAESAHMAGADASQAYTRPERARRFLDDDFQDDPTVDDRPHHVPVDPPLRTLQALYSSESESSDLESVPETFSSSSTSSIQPSEPEHEPSVRSSPASSAYGAENFRATTPIRSGRTQYMAEEECLLVVYLDDVLRVPLPGWPREASLSGEANWTTFYAILEGDGITHESRPPREVGT